MFQVGCSDDDNLAEQLRYVRLWVLTDKYDIRGHQDDLMLELLDALQYCRTILGIIKEAFENTPPGSKLRKLMAEETVRLIKSCEGWKYENLDELDGVVGFTAAVVQAMATYDDKEPNLGASRLRIDEDDGWTEKWKEYMVGSGPSQHWVFYT